MIRARRRCGLISKLFWLLVVYIIVPSCARQICEFANAVRSLFPFCSTGVVLHIIDLGLLRPCLADYSERPNLTLFVYASVCAWNAMSEDVQLLGFGFIMSPNSKWHFEPYSLFAVTLILGLLWEGLSFHEWSWHHLIQGRCPLW